MTPELIEMLNKGGTVGALMVAVYYVAKKLSQSYEGRIAALERASEICEKDRVELRTMILKGLSKDGATFKLYAVEDN